MHNSREWCRCRRKYIKSNVIIFCFGVGTPVFTIDLQCGSALESIAVAAAKIDSGQADIIIAGGFESSSTAPKRAYNENHPDYEKYGDDWYKVAKFVPDEHRQQAMLEGAERTAVSEKITREQLNRWVLRSHGLAKKQGKEVFLAI